jgi:hypothetical protein
MPILSNNNLGASLQGGALPVQGQPTLGDHANTMMQTAMQQPVGSPARQQMMLAGLQLGQAHAQNLPQPDSFGVDAPDGNTYHFKTQDAAAQFKQSFTDPQQIGGGGVMNNLGDFAQGAVGGAIKATSGLQQILQQIPTGQGTPTQTLGDITNVPQNAAGMTGEIAGGAVPYVAAGMATGGLADAAGLGLAGQAALGATTMGTQAALSTEGGVGTRLEAGALGAGAGAAAPYVVDAVGSLKSAVKNFISGSSGSDTAAVKAAYDTIDQATTYYKGIGQRMVNTINALPDDVTISMQGQGEMLQRISEVPNINADFNPNAMTASDVQSISSKLNQIAQASSEKAAPDIEGLNRDFREWATKALNDADPEQKVGTQLNDAYSQAAKEYENMKQVKDFFKPNANPTSKQITALLKYVQKQMADPQGAIAMKSAIADWAEASGIDLTDNVKAMSYVNSFPKIKQLAIKALFDSVGLGTIFEIGKHL